MIITSRTNDQVKYLIKLIESSSARKKSGEFVVEGVRMFLEIPKDRLKNVYVSESFEEENEELLENVAYHVLTDRIMREVSDTVNPQGIMAIVSKREEDAFELIDRVKENGSGCLVLLDRIQDPGNLGTIIRTAEAAGILGVIVGNGCVDIYNPKVIRSTMGSIFRVPLAKRGIESLTDKIKNCGITTYAACLGGTPYSKVSFDKKSAILIGNEANGLLDKLVESSDTKVKIPMRGKVESLNAAVAASLLMYAATEKCL